jgi:UDP-N-acetylmuramyl pentapeptide phosphotransferase/UDP-N-acetylglucosamine-1-phosphate transferase
MPAGAVLALLAVLGFAMSCLGTRALVSLLRREAVIDVPNERSSHRTPTPRGGGIAIVGAVAVLWLALVAAGALPLVGLVPALGMIGLAAVSWADDLRGLSPALRLLAQFAAVAAGIWTMPAGAVFQGWFAPGLDRAAAALLWVWFVNLFNFMDGIDGLAASEAAAIGIGLALLACCAPRDAALPVAIAAGALGFLLWNWAPARIFMGDVGSIALGYALGYLLLALAARGGWRGALILPAYFLADATVTLVRRLMRGERVWQAHRQHLYQRAVQGGLGHDAVVLCVAAANFALIACAWLAETVSGVAGLALAGLTLVLLFVALGRGARPA